MMKNHRIVLLAVLALVLLLAVGCGVSQDEHDQVVADLAAAESEVSQLEGDLATAEAEAAEAQSQLAEAESQLAEAQEQIAAMEEELAALDGQDDAVAQLRELQEKTGRAVLAAEVLDVMFKVVLGTEDISDEEAIQLFLELSSKVEESGDAQLQEKFQAVLFSFGGEEEGIELVEYLMQMISELEAAG
jgi:putative ABC transport system permease protein